METFSEHYAAMYQAVNQYLPGVDMELVDKAVEYAREKHKNQARKDGSPYIIHPLAVAQIVAEMGLDVDAILDSCSTTASKTPMLPTMILPVCLAIPLRNWWKASPS